MICRPVILSEKKLIIGLFVIFSLKSKYIHNIFTLNILFKRRLKLNNINKYAANNNFLKKCFLYKYT